MRDEPLHSSQARSEYLCFPHLRACLFSQRERAKAHQELQTSKLGKGGLRGGKKEEKKKKTFGASDVSELLQTGYGLQEMNGCMCQGKE